MTRVVVVGGGQAGEACVAKLRNDGFDGSITLICEEDVPPYQRPPLSKAYLLGDMTKDRLFLRPEAFYAENGIDLHLNTRAEAIDTAKKTVTANGHEVPYDHLVLTTGSWPRRLPASIGGDLLGVYTVRSLQDVDRKALEFRTGARVLIVGGGYIGLEAAAVAAKKGLKVTLVEMADRILQRVAAPQTSDYFRELHTSHGVEIREATGLEKLIGDEHVTGAVFSDGSSVDFDFVIVGVGISPETKLAEEAGLEIENGIKTNTLGQSSNPFVWAAGDCASFPWKDGRIRLESVGNAIDQAQCVAENIMGAGKDYVAKPWFWSDQYDTKLQIAGLNIGYDAVVERPGADGSVSFWYYQGDTLLAVDAMNAPRDYMVGKRLIEAGKSPGQNVIADPETELKTLLRG